MTTIRTNLRSFTGRLVLVGCLAAPALALAEPPPHAQGFGHHHGTPAERQQRLEARLAELTSRLGLDAAQQSQVRQILTDAHARVEALVGANPEGRRDPAVHAQIRGIRDSAEDRVWALLRCDQKDRLRLLEREHRADHFEARMERRDARHGHGHEH